VNDKKSGGAISFFVFYRATEVALNHTVAVTLTFLPPSAVYLFFDKLS